MKSQQLSLIVGLPLILVVASPSASIRIGTMIQSEVAMQTDDGQLQKSELVIKPEIEWGTQFGIDFTAVAQIRTDVQDRLEPGMPKQASVAKLSQSEWLDSHTEVELREFYMQMYIGEHYLKLGKQQIVWGQADGLKVLDRVNPQNFREYILADFEDSRVPLWSLLWEFELVAGWDAQLLLVLDQTYHVTPESSGTFALTSPELVPTIPPGTSIVTVNETKPNNTLKDSDVGFQLSRRLNGWDVTLNYLYHYADSPVVRTYDVANGPNIESTYERTNTFGGSASNAFGDFIVRTEIGYTTDRYAYGVDLPETGGVVRGGELSYVVGMDWMGIKDTLISAQIFQSVFDRSSQRTYRDSVETDVTLLIERTFMNEVVTARARMIHDLDTGDGLMSASIKYRYFSELVFSLGWDVFYGAQSGRYGQFDAQDRILLGFEYGF